LSLFGALRAGIEVKSRGALTEFLPGWLDGGRATKSGQSVNWKTALEVTTVLACCKVLCEGVAQVPWKLRRLRADQVGADDAREDSRFRLLHRKPNGFQTSFEFRETIMLHLAIVQNAYVFKNMVGGRLFELIPLDPTRCKAEQLADLSVVYDVTGRDGKTVRMGQKNIWHLRGLSWDGVIGLETIKLAREALGLSLALEEAHARLHENGVQPSGIY
jgi:HK97 family phage portal protein